jgi:hypothetical protein
MDTGQLFFIGLPTFEKIFFDQLVAIIHYIDYDCNYFLRIT